MWTSIVGAALPFLVKILNNYIEKKHRGTEAHRRWISFSLAMSERMNLPADLRMSWKEQGKKLDEMQKEKQGDQ